MVGLVYAKTRFVGFHVWIDAPKEYAHLAVSHRHEFHVEAGVNIAHSNRAVEFQALKDAIVRACWTDDTAINLSPAETDFEHPMPWSCEQIAEHIGKYLTATGYKVMYVDVSEDGENGARLIF